jgi:hypothetical protein
MGIPTLRPYHFESSEDIMTKFESQALHVIRIQYLKAGGSDNPSFLIPAHWNIGILLHQEATRAKHFVGECTCRWHWKCQRYADLYVQQYINSFTNVNMG